MARTIEQIVADQDGRVAAALARVHPRFAELISKANKQNIILGLALHEMQHANSRETIRRAAGFLEGVAWGIHGAPQVNPWSPSEWEALSDYIALAESTSLAQLEQV